MASEQTSSIGSVVDGRYVLEKLLGETGYSLVYAAQDRVASTAVCIKLLKAEVVATDPEAAARFRHEAQLLANLSHPHVVKVYGLGEHRGGLYLAMELLRGISLEERLAAAPLTLAATVRLLVQVADGLAHVHRSGIIHRDLKPANVFVVKSDQGLAGKLIDFGFAGGAQADEADDAHPIMGTLRYMAPEQARLLQRPISPRSDLYAIGCIAYEMLSGKLAFDAGDEAALLQKIQSQQPAPLRSVVADVPVVLERIVDKLLSKNPDDRYQSADGLLQDLRRVEADVEAGRAVATFELDRGSRAAVALIGNVFVGRTEELSRTEQILDRVAAGRAQVLLIGGVSGIGKSALVGEVLNRGLTRGLRVASGKCYAMQTAFPYFGIAEALSDAHRLIARLPIAERDVLVERLTNALQPYLGELVRMAPAWRQIFPGAPSARYEGEAKQRERVVMLVVSLLRVLSQTGKRRTPFALFVDDLQWADSGTIQLIRTLVDQVRDLPVLIVGTYRSEEVSARHPLAELRKAGDAKEIPIAHFQLGPLSLEETREIVDRVCGDAPPDEFALTLHQRSGGNAFFIWELLRMYTQAGALHATTEGLTVDMDAVRAVVLSTNLLDIVMRRLADLPALTKRALTAAALFGRDFPFALVQACLDCSPAEAYEAINGAVVAQVIAETVSSGGARTFAFAHDKLLEACARFLPPAELPDLHRRIGEFVERTESIEGADDETIAANERLFDLAVHFGKSSDLDKGLRYCRLAADAARKRLQNEEALDLYRLADSLLSQRGVAATDESRVELTIKSGEVLDTLGRYDEAEACYETGLERVREPFERAALFARLASILQKRGQLAACRDRLLEALPLLGVRVRLSGIGLILGLWLLRARYALVRWTGKLGRRTEPRKADEGRALVAEILRRLWFYHSFHDVGVKSRRMYYLAYRLLFLALSIGDSIELAIAHRMMSVTLCQGPRPSYPRALEHGFSSIEVAQHLKLRMQLAEAYISTGYIEVWLGRNAPAIEYLTKAQEILEQVGNLWERANCHVVLYMAHRALGHIDEALSSALEIVRIAERVNAKGSLASGSWKVGELLILKGEPERGAPYVDRALELGEKEKLAFDLYMAKKVRGMLQLREGKLDEARASFEEAIALNEENNFMRAYIYDSYIGWAESVVRHPAVVAQPGATESRDLVRRAEGRLDKALQMEERYRMNLPYAYRVLARLRHLQGRDRATERALKRAEELIEREQRLLERPMLLETIAEIERDRDPVHAVAKLREARDLYARLGLAGEVARLDARLGPLAGAEEEAAAGAREAQSAQLDALLAVSLAAATVHDPVEQARAALDELVRIFGAERALLFRVEGDGESDIVLQVGRDSAGNDLPSATAYSTTALRRVREQRAPLVVTGTEEGALLGSASAIVHDLRSIMAAPAMIRDRLLGIVYLDNRVEKGIRTQKDVTVLQGIANHIAIAMERTRMAQIELERQALEAEQALLQRDLDLTGTVQSFFFPTSTHVHGNGISVSGFSKLARESGGSWWWLDDTGDGSVDVVVGDGTGQGPAAAMIVASVATAYRMQRRLDPTKPIPKVLETIHERLAALSHGQHEMALSVTRLDRARRSLEWWSAGAPPLLLADGAGGVRAVAASSTALGSPRISIASQLVEVAPNERLLIVSGATLGNNGGRSGDSDPASLSVLGAALIATRATSIDEAARTLGETVAARMSRTAHGADVTLAMAEWTAR